MKVVIAKCVSCGSKKEIKAGEIEKMSVPLCDKCYMPMTAEKVIIKTGDKKAKPD